MEKIQNHLCYFRFDIWVNKSLSIRGIDVFFDMYDKDESDLNIPVWAAYHTVYDVMAHFFPWLKYEYEDFINSDEQSGEVESHIFNVKLNRAAKLLLRLEAFFAEETPIHNPPIPGRYDEQSFLDDDGFDEAAFRRALEADKS